jgi:choline dehydrogenase-like flavoprotein
MLLDFNDAAAPQRLEADLCVVGAGAAGISMARELIGSRLSVILLESGGLRLEAPVQALYEGTNTRGDFALDGTRFRMFGGTTSVWGGWCAPLDEIDFTRRDWVPYSGWPIEREVLLPYYGRAQSLCQLGRYRYEVAEWPELTKTPLEFDAAKLTHRMWQLSPPTRFGETYRDEVVRAPNLTLVLHATATEIETSDDASHVRQIRVSSLGGRRGLVRARQYVIACGGIETPRLLLLSNRVEAAGLGNGHDLVGRFFMEHPHADAGGVLISGEIGRFGDYGMRTVDREAVVLAVGPSPAAQRRLRILNSSLAVSGTLCLRPTQSLDSLNKIARAFESGRWPASAALHFRTLLEDPDDVLREGYRQLRDEPPRGYTFLARTEVAPNPANRVLLSDTRDALGQPRVKLQWRLGDLERHTVESTMRMLAAELGRLDIGRVRLNELLLRPDAAWSENLGWVGHHMGTTRMSESPRHGVVDANCRVHGVANLYLAGAAVFPTGGFANPTLTIVALSLRLADHLKFRFRTESAASS